MKSEHEDGQVTGREQRGIQVLIFTSGKALGKAIIVKACNKYF